MINFRKVLFLILTTFQIYISFGNDNNIDVVNRVLQEFQKSISKTEQIGLLYYLPDEINNLPYHEAVKQWNNLDSIFNELDFNFGNGFCQYFLAIIHIRNGYFIECYYSLQKSLKNFRKEGDINWEAKALSIFGDLYYRLQNYESSIDYLRQSTELYKTSKDTFNEAVMYLNLGDLFTKTNQRDMAKNNLWNAVQILKQYKDTSRLIAGYINLGEIYFIENRIDSSEWYFRKSYDFTNITGTLIDSIRSRYFLGKLYMSRNQLELAKPLLIAVDKLISENSVIIPVDELAEISDSLGIFYQKTGDTLKALINLNKSREFELKNRINQTNNKLHTLNIYLLQEEKRIEKTRRLWSTYISIAGFLFSILLFLAFYRNYKHKKEANRLLTEMDELKNKLYSNITHELRTPLTLILGPLEQMLASETEKTPSHRQVKMMRKNANSLLTLVNQMLDLTKIDAKSMKLELVEEDINKFLRTRFAAFASLADQKSISYKFSLLNEKNIRIFDASKLEKIINNLVSNAVKFTGKNGNINCYANFHHKNELELIVQDDGKGIPKDELNRIYDRFHQVKSKDETINLGTGIGLSLTKELVELLHGKITVESEPGKGSKFTVVLPLGTSHLKEDEFDLVKNLNSKAYETSQFTKPDDSPEECENLSDSINDNDKFPHILVVEDHADIREFIAENLKDCFFIEQAENGKKGLETALKNIPDLVITDIVMPKMDGTELCKILKTDEKTSHIPVVMLTGKSGTDDRLTGLETGADAYLTKPFNIKELRLQVSNLIEQRQKLRERFTRDLRLEPKDIAVTSADEKFIMRAMEIIEKNIGNSEYEVRQFEEDMFMSRMQLFRKIKALTNQTPGDFIRTIRLKRAASLIKQNFGNIAQITYEVGFNNPSYFAKCFKDLYGVLPSDYMKNH